MSDGQQPNPYAPPPAPPAERPSNPTHNPYAPAPREHNPYAPPSASLTMDSRSTVSDVESVRLELLSHEGHVRALGTLYRIFAFFGFLGTAFTAIFVVMAFVGATEPAQAGFALGALAFYAVATWLYYVVGQGLRNLDPKVRLAATVVGAISLIGFPIGTLLGLFLLWAVHGEKGKRVLSYDYRAVVAQTQHIEAKTPFWLAALLILFVALVVAMIIAIVAA